MIHRRTAKPRPTPKQLHTLNAIAALSSESAAGFTYMDIARRSGVTKVTAYEHVKALVAKGLVAHGERWKARGVSLTAAGKRLVKGKPIKCPNCGVPLCSSMLQGG